MRRVNRPFRYYRSFILLVAALRDNFALPATGGGETTVMPQVVAQKYRANVVGAGTRLTILSQAMNQAFNDQG